MTFDDEDREDAAAARQYDVTEDGKLVVKEESEEEFDAELTFSDK
jgi:hypothetical protein